MKKIIIPFILISSFQVFSQKSSEIGDQEINIKKDRKITIPQANRILEKIPGQTKVTPPERSYSYDFRDYKPESMKDAKFTPNIIQPVSNNNQDKEPIFSNLIRLGVGNYGRFFGETNINTSPENPIQMGVQYLHNSTSIGPKDDFLSAAMKTGGKTYAAYANGAVRSKLEIGYQNDRINYYGYQPDLKPYIDPVWSKAEQRKESNHRIGQRMNRFNVGVSLDNLVADSKIDYVLNTRMNLFNSKQYTTDQQTSNQPLGVYFPFLRENDWISNLELFFPIIDQKVIAKIEGSSSILKINNDYDVLETKSYNRNLYKILPSFTYQNQNLNILIGIRGINQYEGLIPTSKAKGYPVAKITYKLPTGTNIFVGTDGDMIRNTLWGLTDEMPFLYGNSIVRNTEKTLEVYTGAKGEVFSGLNYNLKLGFNQFKDLFFFNNDPVISEKFIMEYEEEKINVYAFKSEFNYPINDNFKTSLMLNYDFYDMKQLEKPYHRPNFYGKWFNTFYVSDRLMLTSNLLMQGNRYAKNPVSTDLIKMKPIFDLNFDIDYFFSNQFSGIIKLNNVFNQNYEQYLFYPKQRFNFLCGLNYIF